MNTCIQEEDIRSLMWVLGPELRQSERVTSTLNHSATSPDLEAPRKQQKSLLL